MAKGVERGLQPGGRELSCGQIPGQRRACMQMPTLNNSNFCCLLTKEQSTLSSRDCNLQSRASLALATLEWMEMGVPRKRNVDAPMKGMGKPERGSLGSYPLPVED